MPDQRLANWNGTIMLLSDVKVSVLDRSFLFGDSAYEVVRAYDGKLFKFEEHLQRLSRSLQALKIRFNVETVRVRTEKTLRNSQYLDAIAYIQVTRGEAARAHVYPENPSPNVLIYIDRHNPVSQHDRANGLSVITHPDLRWGRNDIKQTGMTANCMIAQIARERGCSEAILVDSDGYMTEGTHTSIIGVKDGVLVMPPESPKILPGITRAHVAQLAGDLKIPVVEKWIKAEEIKALDEIFLASTTKEILPIVSVDDNRIGKGKPGQVYERLRAAYSDSVARWSTSSDLSSGAVALLNSAPYAVSL